LPECAARRQNRAAVTGNEIITRAVRAGDAEGYHACIDRVARARIYIGITEAFPLEEARTFVADMIARDLPFYVAEAPGGQVVGWCDIGMPKPRPERPGFAHIGHLGMGIDADYRGRGLGERLVRAALAHASRIGLERVELQVFPSNTAARALYQKAGFDVEGVKRRARKLDGRYEDLVQMAILLPSLNDVR
jgi:RimJ/RimL family protein N-acetyltransferase